MSPFIVVLSHPQCQQRCETIRFRDYQARYAKESGNSPGHFGQTVHEEDQPWFVGRDATASAGDIGDVKTTLKEKGSTISNTNSQSELVDAENCMLRPT
jgi:hypothetical protein